MPPLARGQPPRLEHLLDRLGQRVDTLTTQLEQGTLTVATWQQKVGRELKVHSVAAYMEGAGKRLLTPAEQQTVGRAVAGQLRYLDAFAAELTAADELPGSLHSRAALYANSIKAPYWQGVAGDLPLPAYPGDGSTACLTNCKCLWSITTVNSDTGDYDCYWIRHASDSCSTCRDRAADWSPYEIRGGTETYA